MPRYRRFTQRWLDLTESSVVLQPIFRIWFDRMWDEFEAVWTQARPDQLRAVSELVWRNTRRPVETHGGMTPREWAGLATGKNLRWEVIGLILALVGLVAVNLSDWDAIFDDIRESIVDRVTFAERMRKASELVLCFCYECESLNDLYICFMYEGLMLIELIKGDSRKCLLGLLILCSDQFQITQHGSAMVSYATQWSPWDSTREITIIRTLHSFWLSSVKSCSQRSSPMISQYRCSLEDLRACLNATANWKCHSTFLQTS